MPSQPPAPDLDESAPRGVPRRIEWRGGYALTGVSVVGCVAALVLCGLGHWGWGLAVFAGTVLRLARLLLS